MRISDWSSDVCSSDLAVLVAGDACRFQAVFSRLARQLLRPQVDQGKMRVGATGNDVETAFAEGRRKDLGIVDDGAGIDLVFRRQRLAEGHGLGGDDVHQRPALETRKKDRKSTRLNSR